MNPEAVNQLRLPVNIIHGTIEKLEVGDGVHNTTTRDPRLGQVLARHATPISDSFPGHRRHDTRKISRVRHAASEFDSLCLARWVVRMISLFLRSVLRERENSVERWAGLGNTT